MYDKNINMAKKANDLRIFFGLEMGPALAES
jgi:hypothetical protein